MGKDESIVRHDTTEAASDGFEGAVVVVAVVVVVD
eukprot:CAMPEP_0202461206 /NCGR_PEP_ID=MMETSP1360-20130828/48323_1 /ASSEMBLY_ACC=CAM_ASM_000848 /TAXON_ID=515479 /ORGANISM="Licmophora paradoxa, Strain CCMP2313" /LENGTH=34 /DNA_ID= /DNA_START= /DNA_END= /DNA_ORIENTATION=